MTAPHILRAPRIAGVAGGAGTSLVATLLDSRAGDLGIHRPGEPADVLVCRSVSGQVSAAITAATSLEVRPVLVIVADSPHGWPRTVTQRVDMVRPNLPAVVAVGWIEALRSIDNPHAALAAAVHGHDFLDDIPRWARPAQVSAEELVDAVTALLDLVRHDAEVTP